MLDLGYIAPYPAGIDVSPSCFSHDGGNQQQPERHGSGQLLSHQSSRRSHGPGGSGSAGSEGTPGFQTPPLA